MTNTASVSTPSIVLLYSIFVNPTSYPRKILLKLSRSRIHASKGSVLHLSCVNGEDSLNSGEGLGSLIVLLETRYSAHVVTHRFGGQWQSLVVPTQGLSD